MILAIDGGLATLGWSLMSEHGIVHDLGLITTESEADELGKQADREKRTDHVADLLANIAARGNVHAIAAEGLSFPAKGKTNAVAAVCLCRGILAGIRAALRIPAVSVPPKTWQHAVLGMPSGAIDYDQVYARVVAYLERTSIRGYAKLLAIPKSSRNHPVDAVGVGVYVALRRKSRLASGDEIRQPQLGAPT